MKIETKIEFKSYLKLMFTLTYKRPAILLVAIYLFVMVAFVIFLSLNLKSLLNDLYYLPLFLTIYIFFLLPILIYFNARKNFLTYGLIKEKIIYEFIEDKIRLTGETFNIEMEWTKIYKIVEMKHWILIYHSKLNSSLIPKESFGDNLMEFKNLVRSKKIKAKLK